MIAIYVRQSLDQKDSISIETQVDFCKKELSINDDYKVFEDKGYSGKNTSRPAFKNLLKEIESNNITKLVVYRLDRISRSITDFAGIIDYLEQHKVDFVSANEKFDTSTPVGRAMLYIIMVFAQLERETIAQRIRDNYYARGKTGVWLGGPAPLGFDIVKKTVNGKKASVLVPNNDIKTVENIFHLYATTRKSLGTIAAELRAVHGGMWSNVKLSRILHNPVYVKANADIYTYYKNKGFILPNPVTEFDGKKGCALYGKRDKGENKYNPVSEQILSIGQQDGVIDSEIFLQCQAKLDSNKQIKNLGKGKYTWLTGIIKCGYCGYAMTVKVYDGNKYLSCTGRYSTDLCVHKIETHYMEEIENYVFKELKFFIQTLTKSKMNEKKDINIAEANILKIQLVNKENAIENLINNLTMANSTLSGYINKKIMELDTEKKEIERKLNNITLSKKEIEIPDISTWTHLDLDSKRDISHLIINKVLVYNNKIAVNWKY